MDKLIEQAAEITLMVRQLGPGSENDRKSIATVASLIRVAYGQGRMDGTKEAFELADKTLGSMRLGA